MPLKLFELLRRGATLGPDQLSDVQRRIAEHPDDVEARVLLIGASHGELRYSHVLALIRFGPEIWFGASVIPSGSLAYEPAKKEWIAAIEREPGNAVILLNAARFLRQEDAPAAEILLSKFGDRSAAMRRAVARYYDEALLIASATDGRGADAPTLARQALRAHFEVFAAEGLEDADRAKEIWPMREAASHARQASTVRLLRLADRIASVAADPIHRAHLAHTAWGLVFVAVDERGRAMEQLEAAGANVSSRTEVRFDLAREVFLIEPRRVIVYLQESARRSELSRPRVESILSAIDEGSSPPWDDDRPEIEEP